MKIAALESQKAGCNGRVGLCIVASGEQGVVYFYKKLGFEICTHAPKTEGFKPNFKYMYLPEGKARELLLK
ncbi:hypothetical protein tpqmel_0396 [Candidatus Gastranaerophilus sp. (ex Termes propinquus)]|nr:hypothetical protein tpqmel_0396 [Candidatus Gastranaerophilus sp. (ex Termes propinquus)]